VEVPDASTPIIDDPPLNLNPFVREHSIHAFRNYNPVFERLPTIPRLSKAGMHSRSEGWGGLFKDEQYRLIRSASRESIRWLSRFEQTTRFAAAILTLLKERNVAKPVLAIIRRLKPLPDADLYLPLECILDS